MLANPVAVVLVGILAGIVPGLFGGGGGWLLVPLMVLCLGVPWGFASGTVLCAFLSGVTAGVVSVAMAGRAGRQVHTPGEDRVTVVMTAAGVVGAILGKAVLRDWLDGFDWATTVLDSILIAALLVIAGRLFYEVAVGFEPERPKKPRRRHLVMIGLVSLVPGMLSGLIGIGGGILYVPILLCVLHWRPDEARNAARICVLASSVVAVVLYAMSGGVHFPTAAGMFIPAGIAGVVTSSVKFSDSEKRRRVFKVLAGSMASLAIVLTVIHMMRGSEPRVEPGKGSLAMAALVVLVPSAWGVLCAQAQRAIVKRISGRARPAELYDGLD